ncbi:MAG: sulfite exporter TauE/SafE family protein, partial [Lachnospiraceae bacterium]|nr:sulfite exporter TauE/SafE family protein [Lachnospiraceae bacterium]
GYPSNMILTWKNRKDLKRNIFIPLALLVLAGCIPGALLLKNTDAGYIKIVFGVVVVLLGIEMFFRQMKATRLKESKILLGITGFLSGILCGLFGVGALLAAYIGRVTDSGNEFKANISAVFIVENTFRIVLYSVLGIFTPDGFKRSLMLMPFMLLGLFLGMGCGKLLGDRVAKKLVPVLLTVSGIALIVMNL